jgi:tetratricopeptide (TPR) repeat protein
MHRLSILLLFGLFLAPVGDGQVVTETLQPGKAIEKSLAAGQTHSYTINLEKDQFVQLKVEQREIDVIVRVFAPSGNLLREFDSPTGPQDSEYVEVISEVAGTYRVEIAPINDSEPSASGKYELKVVEWRKATEEELRFRKNESTRKAKGLALVVETSQSFDQFRLPETRVTMRIKAAQLLWPSDEKKASALMAQAIETVKQMIASDTESEDDFAQYQAVMALRQQIVTALAPHDPEAALKFLQSSRLTATLNDDQEVQLESSLISEVLANDPKRAFELAEDLLHRTLSQSLMQTLSQLAVKDRELACRLARDIAKKLEGDDFSKAPQSAYLSMSFLQMVKNPLPPVKDGDKTQPARLLSEEEFGELFLKIISEFMSNRTPEVNVYGPEYALAHTLAGIVSQMQQEIKTYAPDRADAINKRVSEVNGPFAQAPMDWQKYQAAAMKEPIETALESVEQAPESLRNSLYQQVVNRVAANGDVSRARQLVSERITDPSQRKQMLHTIQQQAFTNAAQKGRFDEALRLLAKFPPAERLALVDQIIDQIGPGVKKSEAIQYLEQARNLTGSSVRAESFEQMQTSLAIARAYLRYDPNRAFQIVEPLIDQFNEICAAAVTMNGFGGEYYVQGEMTTVRGNAVSEIASDISKTLATLAMTDFDRAKRDADGITRFDARVRALLTIAARTLEIQLNEDVSDGEGIGETR